MLIKSEKYNPNYLAKVVKIDNLRKHSNADKLQITTIDYQDVITGLDCKVGDIYIYFPVECAINKEYLSWSNSFEDKELNENKELKGFFNSKGRVRAIKLRGEKSCGYIVPQSSLIEWLQTKVDNTHFNTLDGSEGLEFDSWGDILICEKYVPRTRTQSTKVREGKSPKHSRLVENQFKLHIDTENLRKNIHHLNLADTIGIHYKKHGTSFVVGNVLTKRKLSIAERILKYLGVKIQENEYDIIYSSRKVIKNSGISKTDNSFYKVDIWGIVKEELKDKIIPGVTLYGEILGYLPDGGYIQKNYDYGCKLGEHKVYIYRITFTNPQGQTLELDDNQIEDYCNKFGLNYSDTFEYYGTVNDLYESLDEIYKAPLEDFKGWESNLLRMLELYYNEQDCRMCTNKVPAEGIVLRVQNLFEYKAWKLKSFRFLEQETKQLDNDTVDIESEQSQN